VLPTLLLLAPLLSAQAQGVGTGRELSNTSGNHTITGRVYFPDGTTADLKVKVQLETTSAPTATTMTNADGAFRFSGLNTGYYTIVVDAGDKYEVFRERIDIERGNSYSPRSVQIPVYLRLKGTGPATKGGVNAGLADVPKPAVDLYTKAGEASGKGDNKKAIELLTKAVEIHPNFALALSELGVQYLKTSQADKAAENLQASLKINPDDLRAKLNYGIALLNLKKLDEAEKVLREVTRQNDALPTAHMYLGIVLATQKRLDDAEQELLKATTSKSVEVAQAHRYLGGIYWGKRDYKKAADELEIYLKLSPKAADAERTQAAIKELRSKQ
jgi:tetratricopeptide (TPR) repeat protein